MLTLQRTGPPAICKKKRSIIDLSAVHRWLKPGQTFQVNPGKAWVSSRGRKRQRWRERTSWRAAAADSPARIGFSIGSVLRPHATWHPLAWRSGCTQRPCTRLCPMSGLSILHPFGLLIVEPSSSPARSADGCGVVSTPGLPALFAVVVCLCFLTLPCCADAPATAGNIGSTRCDRG
jgi:hypothetical protein